MIEHIDSESTSPSDIHIKVYFSNGYGISIIRKYGSFGYAKKLFEVGVLKQDLREGGWALCYDTPITSDVIGHLTPTQVASVANQVDELPDEHGSYHPVRFIRWEDIFLSYIPEDPNCDD